MRASFLPTINKSDNYFKSLGHEVIELSDAESRRWKKTIVPVIDKYIDKMNKKGFDGKKIVEFVEKSQKKNQ